MRRHEDEAAAIPGLDLVAMEVDDRPVLDEGNALRIILVEYLIHLCANVFSYV